ncbi:MAG: DMT family transporter [Deltaproteobacteria bacterium]|nr:DMT family transporter [Deltaproteobacteria bacterium]MDZ4346348.1 DMT family transporter [Candidatus Binatia bacterium]
MSSDALAQLFAGATAICYAAALVSSRLGLRYSTPDTVTLVSILVQNVMLWSAVYCTGGMPQVSGLAVGIFCIVGTFQMGVRLFAYTGVLKIGASRSSSLQSVSPLISASIAITILGEPATPLIIGGTMLVVGGIVLVSWKAERELPSFRWWHLLLPVGAACLTGMNHPLRRYAFSLSNEPLFFSAFMGIVSLAGFLIYRTVSPRKQRLEWNRGALAAFFCTGIFETLSILFIMTSLSFGRVVVVAPIAASYPVWALIGAKIFLRNVEKITLKTILGILSVVAGTAAIHLGK